MRYNSRMSGIARYHIDLGLCAILLAVLALHYAGLLRLIDQPVLIAAALLGTAPVLWAAWLALREREWASMDLLASIALVFSIIAGQWTSAVFIALMLAAARILGDITRDRTEQSIRGLLKSRPVEAKVERGGAVETVLAKDVRVGDIVVADIGECVAVDGEIISGEASVNQASLTGESLPVEMTAGSKVMSSSIIASGSIRIRTLKVGKDTTFERVIALVESSHAEKPDTETLGERFGKLYLMSVFAGSILLFFFTRNLSLVLAVVLVICADDIAVAIPLAYLRAIGLAARRGIIVKGGKHLEALGRATIFVFDKTGTLTEGELSVARVVVAKGILEKDLLESGALAVRRSSHPLSRALISYAASHHIAERFPDAAEEKSGKGVVSRSGGMTIVVGKRLFLEENGVAVPLGLAAEADRESDKGRSISYVAENLRILGFISIADTLKQNARASIEKLKSLGITKTVMLTGDNERAARYIAHELGIDDFYANLMPEEKVARLKELQKEGVVAMVGDGVNDAAALAGAHVGVAMGALGSEGAIESAQIVLMRDDLSALSEAVHLARATYRVSVEDFWIWGVTNIAGLALVFGGVIGPVGAAAYNFVSDFFPLFNSLRVRSLKQGDD